MSSSATVHFRAGELRFVDAAYRTLTDNHREEIKKRAQVVVETCPVEM